MRAAGPGVCFPVSETSSGSGSSAVLCLLRSALLIINQDWEKVTAALPGVTVAMEMLINILFLPVWPMASVLLNTHMDEGRDVMVTGGQCSCFCV